MVFRASILPVLPCLLSGVMLAACGSEAGTEANGAVCEIDPESSVRAQSPALNTGHFNRGAFNTGTMNSGYVNSGYLNSGYINTGYLNGMQVNGMQLNGIQVNGMQLNGINLNGVQTNGTQVNGLQVNGASVNELVGTMADGKMASGDAFVGAKLQAVLADGRSIELVVSGFERSIDGALAYYEVDFGGQNICGPGAKGMFLPGAWDEHAGRHDELTVAGHRITTSFSCTTGMLAKCVAWGYAPWTAGADLHQTCTRMGRADYCGTGVSFTKNGTFIDVYDAKGIQAPTTTDASLVFEAGWGRDGAVCVNRTRYDAHDLSGAAVLPSCWASLPTCSSFEQARSRGATIGNSSRIQSRTLCSSAGLEPRTGQAQGQRAHKP